MSVWRWIKTAVILLALCLLWGCAGTEDKADFGYTLTKEQAENYQSAVCYLLCRTGQKQYYVQYSDCGVIQENGRLRTAYNGMMVKISSWEDAAWPVLNLNGTDTTTGFLGDVYLRNAQGFDQWRYLLEIDREQNKPVLRGIRPYEEGTDEDLLAGNYTQIPASDDFQGMFLYCGTVYQIVYGEDGRPLPIDHWETTEWFGGWEFTDFSALEMSYEPLMGGEYYLLYEITDKQGNIYCSDLIPYPTEPIPPENPKEPDITVKWEKGKRQQLLLEKDGLEVYLFAAKDTFGNSEYALKVKNATQQTVHCWLEDGRVNGNVSVGVSNQLTVQPGKSAESSNSFGFGKADGSAELETIKTLQFVLSAIDDTTGKEILDPQVILVDMVDAWPITRQYTSFFNMTEPGLDARAEEQLLLETKDFRITLVGAGRGDSSEDLHLVFKTENLSQYAQSVAVSGVEVNGMFISKYCRMDVPAGCVVYDSCYISDYNMEPFGDSVATLTVLMEANGPEDWWLPPIRRYWCPVQLAQYGTAEPVETGTILWEQDSVKVGVLGYDKKADQWNMVLTNDSQQDVRLVVLDAATGQKLSVYPRAGAQQRNCFQISAPSGAEAESGEIQFAVRCQVYDFSDETLLIDGTEEIILKANEKGK